MTARAVHWHEGMFLRPHHLQAAERHVSYLDQLGAKFDLHYNWGIRSIELDMDALANYRLVVRSLRARFRDGTVVSIPEDGALPAVDLKPAFEAESNVTVFLAIPVLQIGHANVSAGGRQDGTRYFVENQDYEDENTGVNPQPIQIRVLNLTFLFSNQPQAGYEVLPMARLRKADRAEATPELDTTWFPPLLACDAWKTLQDGILEYMFDRIGKRVAFLSELIVNRGITFDSTSQGDALLFNQLRVFNEAYAVLGTQVFAKGVHPLASYLELCRLIGQLAIFGPTRRTPDLPRYDHDDLATCFYRLRQYFDEYSQSAGEPSYKERPFTGAGLRMQVTLEPSWLEAANQVFVGVRSRFSAEDCVRLLTKAGQLEMKIGSSDRVDEIYRMGLPGLRFGHAPKPPRALPQMTNLVYFQVQRDSQQQEWLHVQKSLTLAVRLNEHLIVGNIQGQRVLTIRSGGQTATMEFTLYVLPQGQA